MYFYNMWEIFLDGDNIPIDHYYRDIQQKVQNIIQPYDIENIIPNVYSQSNMVLKYTSTRDVKMRICCCKTTNKNATDAQILFNAGKAISDGKRVIIISNDKIFTEIENNNNITIITHNIEFKKKVKLRKNTIIKAINEIRGSDLSKDVYLCDLCDHFPNHQMSNIREYINSLHDIRLNGNDCVYVVNY